MTTEPMAVSLAQRLSFTGNLAAPQGYYRSKLFIVPFTTNPLVSAAGPIFSLLERLCVSTSLPALSNIRENIEHELRAFHSRLSGKNYTEEFDALAHYLLSATIDELVGKSYLRVYNISPKFKAFTPFSYDTVGPEQRFFDIVAYIKERPHQYLDLLELAYYCLITGFEGIQHGKVDGRHNLDHLIEELFQLIQQNRVNKTHQLFKKSQVKLIINKKFSPWLTASFIALGILATSFALSFYFLENKAHSIQFGHAILDKMET